MGCRQPRCHLWPIGFAAESVACRSKLNNMCGRYRRRSDKQRIAEAFQVRIGLEELYLAAEEDITPGSMQPVILKDGEAERKIEMMRWGFKLPDRLLFNARAEGIDTAKFWKEHFANRRCIVPADTFFEWAKAKRGVKPKYEFVVPGREPFGMAGIWSPWKNPKTEEWENTFVILTGEANARMRPVHDRQPTILEPRDYEEYLAPTEGSPAHVLRILPEAEMQSQLVSEEKISERQATLFDSV